MKIFNKGHKYINTGKAVVLKDFLVSIDITSRSLIAIYDADGKFILRRSFADADLVDWYECQGTATKACIGCTIKFRLSR